MTQPSPIVLSRGVVAVLASLALALSAAAPAAAAPSPAAAPLTVNAVPPAPRVPSGLPGGIESLAGYTPANSCHPTAKPGTVKLARLLTTTYPGTSYGITRSCGATPNSEHIEGRAVDWMNSVRNTKQAAQARTVISWLLATDKAGHRQANARRLGVMYIIWNNKIWGAYSVDQGWRPYRNCASLPAKSADSTCHRNHMHLSLSWEGAMGATSFWSKSVARADYGPCRPADLNWAAPYRSANPKRCPRYAKVVAPKGASATKRTLVTYSGVELRTGSKGTAVRALQKVVKATVDGDFGPKTKAAVQKWQTAHGLGASGVVYASTWRVLLRAVR